MREVADEHGDAVAEAGAGAAAAVHGVQAGGGVVHGRASAAGGRLVHDVVVDEGEAVQHLDARGRADHVVVALLRAVGRRRRTQPSSVMTGRVRLPPRSSSSRSSAGRVDGVRRTGLTRVVAPELGQLVQLADQFLFDEGDVRADALHRGGEARVEQGAVLVDGRRHPC